MANNSVMLVKNIIEKGTHKQKVALFKARGIHPSFARVKSAEEMAKRGGGMALKNLHSLVKEWRRRNPTTKVIFK